MTISDADSILNEIQHVEFHLIAKWDEKRNRLRTLLSMNTVAKYTFKSENYTGKL